MSDTKTTRMLAAYLQVSQPVMMFFSGLFRSPAQNFHTSERVEIDIVRSDEDVSIVIQDLTAGYRMNSTDVYTNKEFTPPIHKEAVALNAHDLIKRMPGSDPFKSPDFRSNLIVRMLDGMVKVERKIRRSIEQQASQVLQTGIVTLTDAAGVALYSLDYKPKATHFPTAAISWATATGQQMIDGIAALGDVIRDNGLENPDQLIFGVDAFEKFFSDADVRSRFDIRRIDLGTISPMEMRGNGGNYRGILEIGNYRYDVWTYAGRYKDPQTGSKVQYMDPGKVIVRASMGRLDASFGAIPNIGQLLGRGGGSLLPELPTRLSNAAGGMDLFTNVWVTEDGEQMFGGVGARPLMIPTAIDTFGCLDTQL